jgi:molybdopterin converting factor small subunit
VTIHLMYYAQIRRLAGVETDAIELPDGATVLEAVRAAPGAAAARTMVLDDADRLQPVILAVVNGTPAAPDRVLRDGDTITLFSPVAGG